MDIIIWLVALAVFLIIEIATLGLTTVWFAIGSLAALILAALNIHLGFQIAVFIVVSIVTLVFTRPIALKYLNAKTTKTNAESLVGKLVPVSQDIENIESRGQVMVNGIEWSARSADDAVQIKKGTIVQIVGISGVKLIVKQQEIKEEQ